jgi:hypothetical protein
LLTDDFLAYPDRLMRRPLSEAERRRVLMRDTVAWVLVGLIHILLFLGLVISLQQARERQGRRGAIEHILDLSLLRQNRAIPLNISPPEPDEQRDISAKPLTVQPPKAPVIVEEPPAPASPPAGDVLGSIGQFLACSAGTFEYLNPQQQARCLHQPWQGLELPNGTIVMLPMQRQAAPGLEVTGAESLRRQAQTAPNCPIMLNTPCLADMFSGGGAQIAPGIPDPHQ